jgi:hypothetical protein
MVKAGLKIQLEQLKRELAGAKALDPESRATLERLVSDIDGALASGTDTDTRSLSRSIDEAALRFETEHPRLTNVLASITDTLAKLGI